MGLALFKGTEAQVNVLEKREFNSRISKLAILVSSLRSEYPTLHITYLSDCITFSTSMVSVTVRIPMVHLDVKTMFALNRRCASAINFVSSIDQ